jgi:hypothetical protein
MLSQRPVSRFSTLKMRTTGRRQGRTTDHLEGENHGWGEDHQQFDANGSLELPRHFLRDRLRYGTPASQKSSRATHLSAGLLSATRQQHTARADPRSRPRSPDETRDTPEQTGRHNPRRQAPLKMASQAQSQLRLVASRNFDLSPQIIVLAVDILQAVQSSPTPTPPPYRIPAHHPAPSKPTVPSQNY